MPDCFISYSRRDAPFVTRLAEALKSRGKVPWVDLADIPVSADWRVELTEGIAGSDAFIAVISPDWLASAVCQRELEEAAHFNKRIIPIMYRETAEAKVPDVLATPNWVMSREEDDFDQAVDKLVSAIDTDLARVKAHTRLLLRSNEWAGSEDASLLVRGNELSRAQALVALPGSPAPTPLQQRFVAASAAASHQRQRRLLAGVSAALVVAVVLAVVALVQRDSAVHNQHEAESTALTTESVAQLQVDPQRSVSLALSAMRQATTAGALLALRQGVSADQLRHTLPGLTGKIAFGGSGPQSIAFDPADPNTLATEAPGGVIRVWDASLGSAVASLRPARASPELALERFVFNNEGSLLAAVYSDGTVRIWDMRSYKLNAPVARTDSLPVSLSFSSGGGNLYLFEDDGAVVAIDPATGTVTGSGYVRAGLAAGAGGLLSIGPTGALLSYGSGAVMLEVDFKRWVALSGYTDGLVAAPFSPDGQRILGVSYNGTAQLWDADGQRVAALAAPAGVKLGALSGAFSTDGQLVAVGWGNGTIGVFNGLTGALVNVIRNGGNNFAMAFDSEGPYLASGGVDGSIKVWEAATGEQLALLNAGSGPVFRLALNSTGTLLASASTDGKVRIWEPLPGHLLGPLGSNDLISLSTDGTEVVLTNRDDQVLVRRTGDGAEVVSRSFTGGSKEGVFAATLSPNNELLAVPLADGTTIWDVRNGQSVHLPDSAPYFGTDDSQYAFSPDDQLFALSGANGALTIWDARSGRVVHTMKVGTTGVTALSFSPDGQQLALGEAGGDAYLVQLSGSFKVRALSGAHPVSEISFSPNGQFLASTTTEFTTQLWYAHTGRPAGQLAEAGTYINFSPSGNLFAATSTTTGIYLVAVGPHGFVGSPRIIGNSVSLYPAFDYSGNIIMATDSTQVDMYDVGTGELVGVTGLGGSDEVFEPSPGDARVVTESSAGDRLYACDACGTAAAVEVNARALTS